MPHVIERASSGRAKCRACGGKIDAGALRFGERLPNPYGDEGTEMTLWFHPACGSFTRPASFLEALSSTTESVDEREMLEREATLGAAHRRLPRLHTASRAPTGRATCRSCRLLIEKGAWRIGLQYFEDGRFVPSGYIHARCAPAYVETTDVIARVRHFSPDLADADLDELRSELSLGTRPAEAGPSG